MQASREDVLNEGVRAAAAVVQSLADRPAAQPIETNVGSLRSLSCVIDGLVGEVQRCGGADCMGRAIDGTRLWVTLDRLNQEVARADEAEARALRAEAALNAVLSETRANTDRLGLATDWHAVSQSVATIARGALGTAARKAA